MRVLLGVLLISLAGLSSGFLFDDDVTEPPQNTAEPAMVKVVKQNWSLKLNTELNDRINSSLVASYIYLSMAFWCDRADVSLPGFHGYFLEKSHKAREDAESLMKYINKRGGFIKLKKIKNPPGVWHNGLRAMEAALGMEKEFTRSWLITHGFADSDPHLTNYIEDRFLDAKVDVVKEMADHVTRLKSFRVDYNLGEYILDKDLRH